MKVAIVLGSISDQKIAQKAVETLKHFGVDYDVRVISAHRALHHVIQYTATLEEQNIDVVIALAGKSAHLAGVIAGLTTLPVIGVPIKADTLDGLDALLSIVQMPKGVPVATVAIDGSENAAILAVQILALKYPTLKNQLLQHKETMLNQVTKMNEEIVF